MEGTWPSSSMIISVLDLQCKGSLINSWPDHCFSVALTNWFTLVTRTCWLNLNIMFQSFA